MPDGNNLQPDRAQSIANVRARLARYIAVGDEINAQLQALGLDRIIATPIPKEVRGLPGAVEGGLGYQPRARTLSDLLGYAEKFEARQASEAKQGRCIGFEQGCGCATCAALDRHHAAVIKKARASQC